MTRTRGHKDGRSVAYKSDHHRGWRRRKDKDTHHKKRRTVRDSLSHVPDGGMDEYMMPHTNPRLYGDENKSRTRQTPPKWN